MQTIITGQRFVVSEGDEDQTCLTCSECGGIELGIDLSVAGEPKLTCADCPDSHLYMEA